jgi:hypothetical protein
VWGCGGVCHDRFRSDCPCLYGTGEALIGGKPELHCLLVPSGPPASYGIVDGGAQTPHSGGGQYIAGIQLHVNPDYKPFPPTCHKLPLSPLAFSL